MPTVRLSNAAKSALLSELNDQMNAGSGPAQVRLYTGTMPASPNVAITSQVLLGTLTLGDPAGAIVSNELVLNSITGDSEADSSGIATWGRIVDSDNSPVVDFDVTVTGGGGVLQMNTTNIVLGGPINISSFKFTA